MKNSNKKIDANSPAGRKANRIAWFLRGLLFVVAAVAMIFTLLIGTQTSGGFAQFLVEEPAPRSLFSPFEVSLINQAETDRLRQERREEVLPVYDLDLAVREESHKQRDIFFQTFEQISALEADAKNAALEEVPFTLSEDTLNFVADSSNREEIKQHVDALLKQVVDGVLATEEKQKLLRAGEGNITVFTEGEEKTLNVFTLFTPEKLTQTVDDTFSTQGLFSKNRSLKKTISEILALVVKPNLSFNETLTAEREQAAELAVTPVLDVIKKNELIIQRGRLVTIDTKRRIDSVQSQLKKRKKFNRITATSMIVFLTYFFLFLYLKAFEKSTLKTPRKLFLLHVVFLSSVALCKVIALWPGSSIYLMPTALAALLLVLLLGPRLGAVCALVMAIFAGIIAEFQPDIVFATILSSLAGTFTAFGVRKRIHFIKVGLAVGATFFAVLFAFQFFKEYAFIESLQHSGIGLANGLLVTIPLCFMLLPIFENVFNLTTDITLLELSDLNHPLLKRMIVEAPGTYHHSLVVSTLAEAACERIGANSLLARVGCYFHDIGKIAKAEFFTENMRQNRKSKHEVLSPEESFEIITNHVTGGLTLGKQYKLKDPILRFIPEHQGTGVVWYFYKKAMDHAKPGEKVDPDDYRYVGPKPQSRETAVAMLADSCEAASRSLKEPNPDNLRQLVRKIINDKFIDGQLDECDITLQDLHKIQESFVTNLMAIYHTRVSYPAKPETEDKVDLFEGIHFPKKFNISRSQS